MRIYSLLCIFCELLNEIFDRVFLNKIGILKTLCGDKVTKERENLSFKS